MQQTADPPNLLVSRLQLKVVLSRNLYVGNIESVPMIVTSPTAAVERKLPVFLMFLPLLVSSSQFIGY